MSDRATKLNQWLEQCGYSSYQLNPASEDASFRSYLRLQTGQESLIVMDAPPSKEPCDQFIAVARMLRDAGLNAPEILAHNATEGFLLLTDFGSNDYLSQLTPASEASLYSDALAALLQMQAGINAAGLPPCDEILLNQEMDLFDDWFLGQLLNLSLDPDQRLTWNTLKQTLIDNALSQPQVFVHRDYHSRNLMQLNVANPGILDFQDAVKGPITYDLVSLLRDCYVDWPQARVQQLALEYFELARGSELVDVDEATFLRWFNLMGVQRHLKVMGIFSRLKIRDGKPGYLRDIPRTLNYLVQVSGEESSISGLNSLIDQLELSRRLDAVLSA